MVFVIKNGVRWRDAPSKYAPHKTIYNRFVRWSRLGVFNKIFAELARKGGKTERVMIDATHLKAHRTAASLLKKGIIYLTPSIFWRMVRPEIEVAPMSKSTISTFQLFAMFPDQETARLSLEGRLWPN